MYHDNTAQLRGRVATQNAAPSPLPPHCQKQILNLSLLGGSRPCQATPLTGVGGILEAPCPTPSGHPGRGQMEPASASTMGRPTSATGGRQEGLWPERERREPDPHGSSAAQMTTVLRQTCLIPGPQPCPAVIAG